MKLTKSMKTVLYILLIGIIVNMLLTPHVKKEGFKGRKALLLLHMEGCPHCVKLMPEWDKFTEMNDTSIATKSVEKDEDKSLVKRYLELHINLFRDLYIASLLRFYSLIIRLCFCLLLSSCFWSNF